MTFTDYYELEGIRNEFITTSKTFWIETGCNIDGNLNYIVLSRLGEYDKICRLFIDKPEYFICDFYLTNDEIDEIINVLKDNWQTIINIMNKDKIDENLYPLINKDLKIPDYSILKADNYTKWSIENYYELKNMRDEIVSFTEHFKIYTGCNIDGNLNYIKIYKLKDFNNNVCRLYIDKANYFICDFYLTNEELDEIVEILKNNWGKIISMINKNKTKENLYPLIDINLKMPDYNILK